jgi:hypothetical protein
MKTKQFRIGRLATLGQVIKALGKTIRAMSDGSLDSQVGGRICNGGAHDCDGASGGRAHR